MMSKIGQDDRVWGWYMVSVTRCGGISDLQHAKSFVGYLRFRRKIRQRPMETNSAAYRLCGVLGGPEMGYDGTEK
jgi:hypothetical protein